MHKVAHDYTGLRREREREKNGTDVIEKGWKKKCLDTDPCRKKKQIRYRCYVNKQPVVFHFASILTLP